MNWQHLIFVISWAWPILGVALTAWAVWRLCKRRWLAGALCLGAGLALAGSFVALLWFVSGMFLVQGGPDSPTSREAFERVVGIAPPSGISEVRYWGEGFTDHTILMRFRFSDAHDVDAIRERLGLTELDEKARPLCASPRYPAWWRPDVATRYRLYGREESYGEYSRNGTYLWVDMQRRIAFLKDFST